MFWKIEGNGGFSPQTFTNDTFTEEDYKFLKRFYPETHSKLHKTGMKGEDEVSSFEINVAGWEKDEIEVTQQDQYVVVTAGEGETHSFRKEVYVGNNKVSKATYKAGMLTLHFEDTTSVIPIE